MASLLQLLLLAALFRALQTQLAGTQKTEAHPPMMVQQCTAAGCNQEQAAVTLDSERRWLHDAKPLGKENCVEGGTWSSTLCPDPQTCAQQCAVDGVEAADYTQNYGITASGNSLRLNFETVNQYGKNIGARVYMMETEDTYKMFRLKNKEIAFDIDVSSLPCGINAAVYMVAMDPSGGKGTGGNMAGAKYGTGYCDAACPKDLKFVQGEANMEKTRGMCCPEVDLFEGNSVAEALTVHPCRVQSATACTGPDCGDAHQGQAYMGMCDGEGCDFNAFRDGDKTFFGPGLTVDTNRPITVLTQFVTSDGTDTGPLSEIRRIYSQDGRTIQNTQAKVPGVTGNSISDAYCTAEKQAFKGAKSPNNAGDSNRFAALGGMQAVGTALDRGMVLVMSLWDDPASHLHWLDSSGPGILPPNTPGYVRGPCTRSQGYDVEKVNQAAFTTISNIRYGPIGSTGVARASASAAPVAAQQPAAAPSFGSAAAPMPALAVPLPAPSAPAAATAAGQWQPLQTAQGQTYYWNKVTGKTSWSIPAAYESDSNHQVRDFLNKLKVHVPGSLNIVMAGVVLMILSSMVVRTMWTRFSRAAYGRMHTGNTDPMIQDEAVAPVA